MAGIFAYSKTKGLFAGVSLEGSAIIERRDANEKLYGTRYTAAQLLTGSVQPPPQASSLMAILNSRVFSGMRTGATDDSMYNDIPVYDDRHDDVVWDGGRGSAMGEGERREDSFGAPKRSNTWQDDVYDRPGGFAAPSRSSTIASARTGGRGGFDNDYSYSDSPAPVSEKRAGPGRPAAPKPNFGAKPSLKQNEAVAVFNFDADQPGDLAFKKGEIITVLKKTDSDNDWWYVQPHLLQYLTC